MSRAVNRACVLTPAGRGAVAVIAAIGPAAVSVVDACFGAANGRRLHEQPPDRIVFGHWQSGDHREEVIVVRGGDSLEIHCHGGAAASGRIIAALEAGGCNIEPWQDWIEAAAKCPIAAEAEIALAGVTTRRAAAILLAQRHGALSRELLLIQQQLRSGDLQEARRRLTALLERAPVGLHLAQPWQVAIAGRPNVGKSSLINALVGYQRAIVFDQPGTTRDVLTAETAIDGWPVRLADAAGIRATCDPLEAEGVFRARRQLMEADLVLWVLDAVTLGATAESDPRAAAERDLAEQFAAAAVFATVVVVNKVDLAPEWRSYIADGVIATSALMGDGIGALLAAIAQRLVPKPPGPEEAVPFTEQQVHLLERALWRLESNDGAAAAEAIARLTARHRDDAG
jgi:tRNA modification GTPase